MILRQNATIIGPITIERMSYGAEAIAHMPDGRCVFVRGAVTGDVCEAAITEEAKHYLRAEVTRILAASPYRVKPAYSYDEQAGGCPWANLAYDEQLKAKKANVVDALIRTAHIEPDEAQTLVRDVIPSKKQWGYRNKIELSASTEHNTFYLGMYDPIQKRLIQVLSCALVDKRFSKLTKSITGALQFIARSQQLGIERIALRTSVRTKDVELALWTTPGAFPRGYVVKVLNSAAPELTSIVRVLTKGSRRARRVCGVEKLYGKGYWEELIAGRRMRISAPSFFQVNTHNAEKLIERVMDDLDVQPNETALDLYCGAGTFTLPLAERAHDVIGVEAQGSSIQDLRRHIKLFNLHNVQAIGGDALREYPKAHAEVIVVDPPRAGLEAGVCDKLSESGARAIAYVSCDPQTLARDIRRFIDKGAYLPAKITPVDLFPQSWHIENVCLMLKAD